MHLYLEERECSHLLIHCSNVSKGAKTRNSIQVLDVDGRNPLSWVLRAASHHMCCWEAGARSRSWISNRHVLKRSVGIWCSLRALLLSFDKRSHVVVMAIKIYHNSSIQTFFLVYSLSFLYFSHRQPMMCHVLTALFFLRCQINECIIQ